MSDEYAIGAGRFHSFQMNDHANEPIVTFTSEGTIEIAHPDKIDETARLFLQATSDLMLNGFVVRKKGVSNFLQVRINEIEWTQNPEHATRFAREQDADLACASFSEEVVPYTKAMVF